MTIPSLPYVDPNLETFNDELIDKFAIAALPALIGLYNEGAMTKTDIARESYRIAYAMLLAKIEFQGDMT